MAEWPYSTQRWQRLRRAKLAQQPICQDCAPRLVIPATDVDHVVPISEGGEPFPPLDGLAAYCHSCHSRKTARGPEAGAVRGQRHGVDPATGLPMDPGHWWTEPSSGQRSKISEG